MIRVFLPLIISLSFIFESIFVELFPFLFTNRQNILVPHFLMVVIIFTTVYGNKKQGLWYGAIFGLLFDIVYTEIIGIHLFMIPLVARFIAWLLRFQTNIFVISINSLFGVALLELGVYGMNILIGITDMEFAIYLDIRLLPTLILNSIFIIIIAFPLKKFFDSYIQSLRND